MNLLIHTGEPGKLFVDVDEANALIADGQLDGSELTWHEGLSDWYPLRSIQGISGTRGFRRAKAKVRATTPVRARTVATASAPVGTPTVDESKKLLGGIYHPWRRLFARVVDGVVFGLIPFFLISVTIFSLYGMEHPYFRLLESPYIAVLMSIVPILPLEAICLSLFGTTPGKFLYGIKVVHATGRNLSPIPAFFRTLLVYVVGFGACIPITGFVALIIANYRLSKGQSTVWDNTFKSVVTHSDWSKLRLFLVIIITLPIFAFNAFFIVINILASIGAGQA